MSEEGHRYREYRVRALVETPGDVADTSVTAVHEVESAWLPNRNTAVCLARTLDDRGCQPSIETRERESYGPRVLDAVPDREVPADGE